MFIRKNLKIRKMIIRVQKFNKEQIYQILFKIKNRDI